MENIEAFIDEIREVCKKHNLFIGGCGCCGSPYIYRKTAKGHDCIVSDAIFDLED